LRYVILLPVVLLVTGVILFPIVSSIYGLIKWRGSWRLASAIPLLVLFLFFAPLLRYPQNWWALAFIPLTILLSAYSGVVVLLHRRGVGLQACPPEGKP
jgi:hypothetical protein